MSEAALATPTELAGRLVGAETLVWWDKPDPGATARWAIDFNVVVMALFSLSSLFFIVQMAAVGKAFFLLSVPFLLMGLWVASAPIRAHRRASRTYLALTNRRALIVQGATTKAFPLEHVAFVECEGDGSPIGHVLFHHEPGWAFPGSFNQEWCKAGFIGVREHERVGATMLELIEARRSGGAPT